MAAVEDDKRRYMFQREYQRYAAYLGQLLSFSRALIRKIWSVFLGEVVKRTLRLVLRAAVIVGGLAAAVFYVSYEYEHGRSLSLQMVVAVTVILFVSWLVGSGWEAPIRLLTLGAAAVMATGAVALVVGSVTVVILVVFGAYLAGLIAITSLSFLVFLPIRFAHQVGVLVRRIRYTCPYSDCKYEGVIPLHACPTCGHPYLGLRPSFLGVFHHVCVCNAAGTRLPTLDLLGRDKLARYCPGHDPPRELFFTSVGELGERILLLAGGPRVGKTMFLKQALDVLKKRLSGPGQRAEIDSVRQRRAQRRDMDRIREGQRLDKTVADVVVAHGLALRLKKPRKLRALVQLYDPPGEFLAEPAVLDDHKKIALLDGVLLIVDPFASTSKRDHPRRRQASGSDTLLDKVAANVCSALRKKVGRRLPKLKLAVVLNKVDELVDAPQPGSSTATCRDYIENELGEEESVARLQDVFSEVRYFACSATGRSIHPAAREPLKPDGVAEPLLWILGLL